MKLIFEKSNITWSLCSVMQLSDFCNSISFGGLPPDFYFYKQNLIHRWYTDLLPTQEMLIFLTMHFFLLYAIFLYFQYRKLYYVYKSDFYYLLGNKNSGSADYYCQLCFLIWAMFCVEVPPLGAAQRLLK